MRSSSASQRHSHPTCNNNNNNNNNQSISQSTDQSIKWSMAADGNKKQTLRKGAFSVAVILLHQAAAPANSLKHMTHNSETMLQNCCRFFKPFHTALSTRWSIPLVPATLETRTGNRKPCSAPDFGVNFYIVCQWLYS